MAFINFEQFAEQTPESIDGELLELYLTEGLSAVNIDPTAKFAIGRRTLDTPGPIGPPELGDIFNVPSAPQCKIGKVASIGAGCRIGPGVVLEDGVSLGHRVNLAGDTMLRKNVTIPDDFTIEPFCYFEEGASIEALPPARKYKASRARYIGMCVSVGQNVTLPSEVVLGDVVYVPNSGCVEQIGPFATTDTTATIYAGAGHDPMIALDRHTVLNFRADGNLNSFWRRNEGGFIPIPTIEAAAQRVRSAHENDKGTIDELARQRKLTGVSRTLTELAGLA